jgi:hypothetical protein
MVIFDNMPLVKKLLFLLASLTPLTMVAQMDHHWQQEVNWRIDVSLNDTENNLRGFIRMQYINHSPDTLHFIWLHVWPNAYKTDRSAFSDRMLENGRTDLYFSGENQRGYINHLDFRIDGRPVQTENDPQYIDIIKIILPEPLTPGQQVLITSPFFEKIPFDFFGEGHRAQSYHLSHWYPQPAVYNHYGWHQAPYLAEGGDFAEYGSYDVYITLPRNYAVAATGDLMDEGEKDWLRKRAARHWQAGSLIAKSAPAYHRGNPGMQALTPETGNRKDGVVSDPQSKTVHFRADQCFDFSWYADKEFMIDYDSLEQASGRTLDVYSFYPARDSNTWKRSIPSIKNAIEYRTKFIGEYPGRTIMIIKTSTGQLPWECNPLPGRVSSLSEDDRFALAIERSVGSRWFGEMMGSDQRLFHWMSEGLNYYYDCRYADSLAARSKIRPTEKSSAAEWLKHKLPDNPGKLLLDIQIKERADQPVTTNATEFTLTNYCLVPSVKTALWLRLLEDSIGKELFDSCMRAYFLKWQFRHPDPADLMYSLEKGSGKDFHREYSFLEKPGPVPPGEEKRKIRPTFLFSLRNTDNTDYINIGPGLGYNYYDQFMIGVFVHNYNLPPDRFQFFIAPLYATGSKQFDGLADLSYNWLPDGYFQKIRAGLSGSRFSSLSGTDSLGNRIFGGFYKIVPSLRLDLRKKTDRSTLKKWIGLKTFLIGEKSFNYYLRSSDSLYYPTPQSYTFRYLNQFDINWREERALYPYSAQIQFQQSNDFYRVNLTGIYFFNYASGGGLQGRLFAAKFGYIGEKTSLKTFETSSYQPKLTAVRGSEDYTYSNYFLGRNETSGFASQQIMIRDGGLKLRTDLFQGLQGRSDNWITSLNVNSTLPGALIPSIIPLRIFLDVGTYADAWTSNPPTSRFLYVGGLQLSLLKGLINIYAPIIYSKVFGDNLKTVPEENSFWKKISFSIDIQDFDLRKFQRKIPIQ